MQVHIVPAFQKSGEQICNWVNLVYQVPIALRVALVL